MIALLGLFVLFIVLSQTHSWANVVALDWLEYTNEAINKKKEKSHCFNQMNHLKLIFLNIIIISENHLLNEKLSWLFENNLYVCIISFYVQQYHSNYNVNVAFDRNQNHINTRNRLFLLAGLKQPLIQHMLLSSGTQKSCL